MWKEDDKQIKLCQFINNWHQKLQINHFIKLIVGGLILQTQRKSPTHFKSKTNKKSHKLEKKMWQTSKKPKLVTKSDKLV